MFRAAAIATILTAASACAGGPGPGGFDAGGAILEYAAGDAEPLGYLLADTTEFAIAAGAMGTMRVISAQSAVAELFLRQSEDGLVATVRLPEYSGRFENPNQGVRRADEGDIRGAWTIRLGPRGRVAVVDSPTLTAAAREISGGESLVRPLFVHLHGGLAPFGSTWVDTVSLTERTAETVSQSRSIIRSSLVGDTLVDGQRLALIRTESSTDLEVEGTSGGVEILQRMDGTVYGTILWDPHRSLLVERTERGQLEGTLDLPGMGFEALQVRADVRRRVELRAPSAAP